MVLKLTLKNRTLSIDNLEVCHQRDAVSYILCKFDLVDLTRSVFLPSDVLVAVFKSASFNIKEEVLLHTSYTIEDGEYTNISCFGFIPGVVFEHGGVIQILVYKKVSIGPYQAQESTNTVEFFIHPKRYFPLNVADVWQILANDVIDLQEAFSEDTVSDVIVNGASVVENRVATIQSTLVQIARW